jgi:hypothetical protein
MVGVSPHLDRAQIIAGCVTADDRLLTFVKGEKLHLKKPMVAAAFLCRLCVFSANPAPSAVRVLDPRLTIRSLLEQGEGRMLCGIAQVTLNEATP